MKTNLSGLLSNFFLLCILLLGCEKDETAQITTPQDSKNLLEVESFISALEGGTLITSDSVQLIIPPNSLKDDGMASLNTNENYEYKFQEANLKAIGNPISITIPVANEYSEIKVTIPNSFFKDAIHEKVVYQIEGYNLKELEYSTGYQSITVKIHNGFGDLNIKGENLKPSRNILIRTFIKLQSVPDHMMDIKKVYFDYGSEEIRFEKPTAASESEILLMVHGWIGDPTVWRYFLPKLEKEYDLNYSEIWTFGYDSGKSIDHNGRILDSLLRINLYGAKIDVLAHSMGGLVSRAMIENYQGSEYVSKLVTLGTPHEGSPLAASQYILAHLAGITDPEDVSIFNNYSKGMRDLDNSSKFILELRTHSAPIPYFCIASICGSMAYLPSTAGGLLNISSSSILPGPDDGLVTISSAKGVDNATSSEDIIIDLPFAHLEMPFNDEVYSRVIEFLKKGRPSVKTYYVTQKNQYSAILVGDIIDNGGYGITSKGFYWGKNPNVIKAGQKILLEASAIDFRYDLSGLEPNSKYYVVAFATNKMGTTYGHEIPFTTSSPSTNKMLYFVSTDLNVLVTPNVPGSHSIEINEWKAAGYDITYMNSLQTGNIITEELLSNYSVLRLSNYNPHNYTVAEGQAIYSWVQNGGKLLADIHFNADINAVKNFGVERIDGVGGGSTGRTWIYNGAPLVIAPVTGPFAVSSIGIEAFDRPILKSPNDLNIAASYSGYPVVVYKGSGNGKVVITFDGGSYSLDVIHPFNAYRAAISMRDNLQFVKNIITYLK